MVRLLEDTLDEGETRRHQGIVGCLMYLAQVLRYDITSATAQRGHPMGKPYDGYEALCYEP